MAAREEEVCIAASESAINPVTGTVPSSIAAVW